MTKSVLVARVAAKTVFSNASVAGVLDAVISTISEALARGESVSIAGSRHLLGEGPCVAGGAQSPVRASRSPLPPRRWSRSRPGRGFATPCVTQYIPRRETPRWRLSL